MRVVMLTAYPQVPGNPSGGVEAVAENLVLALGKIEALDLHVLAFDHKGMESRTVNLRPNCTIHFIRDTKFKNKRLFYLTSGRKLVSDFLLQMRPDIVHLQGNGAHLMLAPVLRNYRTVLTRHGNMYSEMKLQLKTKSKLIYLLNHLIDKLYSPAISAEIFISSYNSSLVQVKPAKKNALIYNPVKSSFFDISPLQGHNNALLFVGGIKKAKGLLDLLKALHLLSKKSIFLKLGVIGTVLEPDYYVTVREFIKGHGLESLVTFYGPLSQDEICSLYASNSALVLPSYQECLPMCVAEAMAAGRVAIATNVGGTKELIEDKVNGYLYAPGNFEQLAALLEKVFSADSMVEEIGSRAREFAAKTLMAEIIAEKTYNFYRRIRDKN